MNRLSVEKSPYLKMHANNPVDWYPWGKEAFSEARKRDKPIFLSVGYSSCHWCHVIAHESFEDEEVAAALNRDYLSVKVDKEERPDVDMVYMDAVELSAGSGGWPMTLLLTPEGAPFFAATYIPKDELLTLLSQAARMWKEERASVLNSADEFVRHMRALADGLPQPKAPDAALTRDAVNAYAAGYDQKWGGFGRAPKFPAAHNLLFLLAYYERTGSRLSLAMAEDTLAAMYRGGIFDHIGGGFCRYSVDKKWLVPHFEKMLYDNALLLWAYAEAWRVAKAPLFQSVARRTANYVLREMTGPDGEFYSSQDADSEGREGAYYVFHDAELLTLLGAEDGKRFCGWYGITPGGHFEGKSIPNRIGKAWDPAGENAMEPLRERVYRYRRERCRLNRDGKVLTSWNALMIAALCAAADALKAPEYLEAARRAWAFLRARLTDGQGGVMLRWHDGEAKGAGVLADYAFAALALMTLNQATGDEAYLREAQSIAREMLARFLDHENGGLYLYGRDAEPLITRPKDIWDGAMPSGNSCAALALWMLAKRTDDPFWQNASEKQLRFIAGAAEKNPTGHGFGLLAITRAAAYERPLHSC